MASGCLLLWFYGDGWADPLGELALIGRAAETEIIDRLLGDAFSGRSGVLVLTGEAGAGKSALLAYARARADGMGVLQTAGVQSEAEIEFAALYQLLRPALDGVGSLPPPQSAALGAALGVEPGRSANRFLIGAAVLSVLSAAAGDRPLLCLVDDAGWLDYESAVALAFAARRLEAEAVVVIAAARSVAGTPFAGFPVRQIEGLSRSQAGTLLAAHHPRVDPLIRERLIERADGNPLALLEFANQLQDAAQLAPPFAVGLAPTAVESLYLEQVCRLPDDTQLLLLVAAAEDSQALGLIIRAGSRLGLEPRALEPAEQAGIVSVARNLFAAEAAWFAGHGERLEQLDTFVSSLPASPDMPGRFMRSYVGALAATLRGGLPAAAFQLKAAAGLTGRLSEQRPLTWAGDCAMLLQDSAGAEELYSRLSTARVSSLTSPI